MRAHREAIIDLNAISANVEILRRVAGTPHFLAVTKANGYGHGAGAVAHAALAGGADWIGVVDAVEARALRDAGIRAPILTWLHGPRETFQAAVELGLDVGVSSLSELERAAAAGVSAVHVKVDTGLGRNGSAPDLWAALFERACALQAKRGPRVRGLFSHLANAGEEADASQLEEFERARAVAASVGVEPELLHMAATEGTLRRPAARYNMVRVGLGCYGLSPFADSAPSDFGLTPALELSGAILSVKRVAAGCGVSYGFTYRTERETSLALVPLGYADGVPRHASDRGPVSINGERFTVSGIIAMDQFVVDVGDAPVAVGDRAVLFGDPASGVPSSRDWADAAGTIDYEIVARLGARIERRFVGGH
ncbi:MAG: alanine racemase [Terrimesophilobacter sp.]